LRLSDRSRSEYGRRTEGGPGRVPEGALGEAGRITVRLIGPVGTNLDASTLITPVVIAHSVNTADAARGITTPATSLLLITTTTINDAVTSSPYSAKSDAIGGAPPYSWHVNVPETFTIDNTGLASGTFTSAGNATISVTVTDSANPAHNATKRFPLRVADPLTITTTSLPIATQGFFYSTTLTSTGGTAPIHWSVVTSVPDDMTLSDGGTISGISPFTETPVVQVRATDSSNPPQVATSLQMPLYVYSAICTGESFELFNNSNTGAVSNGGVSPTFSTNGQTYCLSSIVDYHWNNAQGAQPGTIGLMFNSRTVGNWSAVGSAGQNNAPNVNWTAVPDPQVIVMNGTYKVIDSDPATWSQDQASGGFGFSHVWVRTALPASYTVTGRFKYNGAPRTPTTTPQFFLRNEVTGQQQPATITWGGADTFTISGIPAGTFGVEAASKETASALYFPGGFYSFTTFDSVSASDGGFDVTLTRLIHVTVPADNSTAFAAYACPPALSIASPSQFSWDAIEIPATYSYQINKWTCDSSTGQFVTGGSTAGASVTLVSPLAPTAANEYYTITINAYSSASPQIIVGQIMTNGTNWHGWDLRFTVPSPPIL